MQGSGAAHRLRIGYQRLGNEPRSWVVVLAAAQVVVWTTLPYFLAVSLPLDVVSDGIAWGHEWQFGYYKHPPLVSWLSELSFVALGDLGPFLLSQVCIAATYAIVFLLGKELMPEREAATGTILLVAVYYFSIPTPEFNHNIALMPVWAALLYCYWRAIHARKVRWWIALGLAGGVGVLIKYTAFLLVAAISTHALLTQSARPIFATWRPYVGVGIAILVALPHLLWLGDHDLAPLYYAQSRAGPSEGVLAWLLAPVAFVAAQMLALAPAVGFAALVGLIGGRPLPDDAQPDAGTRFLLFVNFLPLGVAIALSLITGLGLRSMWGAPMWCMFGLLIVKLAYRRWTRTILPRLHLGALSLFILLPLLYAIATDIGPRALHRPARTLWPDRAIAGAVAKDWQEQTGCPLRIVASDGWLAGLIAMRTPSRPSVFTDGDVRKAPWITVERIRRDGVLVVWHGGQPPRARLSALVRMADTTTRSASFHWPRRADLRALEVHWTFIRPSRPCGTVGTP